MEMSGNTHDIKEKIPENHDKTSKLHRQSFVHAGQRIQLHTGCTDSVKYKKLPLLKDCKRNQQEGLVIKKLQQCDVVFDFSNRKSNFEAKEIKTKNLIELCEYFTDEKHILTEQMYLQVVKMVAANIFRTFPCLTRPFDINEPEDSIEDASWMHLKLVYEFLIIFLDMSDFNQCIGSRYIDEQFLMQLLDTFNSSDARERAYLKTVLHRIYGKLLNLRGLIRQHINNIFLRFIYETESMNGIGELLEVFGSIINGFIMPLKPEHRTFLQKILIPLHKPTTLCLYHTQLTHCVLQFIEKDSTLIEMVIHGLLKYWPITCSQKQVLFLNELEKILLSIDAYQFERVQKPLFKKLAQCIASPHFLVSQRALYFWNNDDTASLIESNANVIMPIVFPSLYRISKEHWNNAIIGLVGEVLKLFHNIQPELYQNLKEKLDRENTRTP